MRHFMWRRGAAATSPEPRSSASAQQPPPTTSRKEKQAPTVVGGPDASSPPLPPPGKETASAAADLTHNWPPEFSRLKLRQEDILALAAAFARMDATGSGLVAMPEFYRFLAIAPTPFAYRVFHVLDEDGNGAIDFRDFVLSVWNYCTLDAAALARFAFTCYDADVSGHLDPDALRDLVREMYGDKYVLNSRVMAIFNEVGAEEKLSYNQFVELNTKFPSLLFPAFTIQSTIRRRVLGDSFWEAEYARRAAIGAAASYSIFDVLHAMEDARLKAGSREVAAALKDRYVPKHLRDRTDIYLPTISGDPVAKGKARRASLGLMDVNDDLTGLGGGGGEAKRRGSALAAALAAGAAEAAGGADTAERDKALAASAVAALGTRAVQAMMQRMTAGEVRRVSVLADSGTRRVTTNGSSSPAATTAAEAAASGKSGSGGAGDGAASTKSTMTTTTRPAAPKQQQVRVRRTGLANAQERAARMALNR